MEKLMSLEEYEERLRELTVEELQKFNNDFGGGQKTIEQRVRELVDHPEHERRICQLLGLKTEAEKLTKAALKSANAADQSAASARLSMIWSGIACTAAIAAVVVAIIGLFMKG
jgi:ferric-dicitrate binding protein FerR (iron transport regulator)